MDQQGSPSSWASSDTEAVDPEESSAAGKRKAPGFLGRNGSIYIVIRRSMYAECMYNICLICLFKSHIVFFKHIIHVV